MSASDTPVFQQYRELKARAPDTLLFFRLGDFYELFWEDAIWTSAALELTLTSRSRDSTDPIPMCGVPYHAAEGYIARLVELGKKVAIAEQVGTAGDNGKKLIRRDIVRIITPGLSGDSAPAHEPAWLVALTQDKYGIGVAFLDVSTGELRVTEFNNLTDALVEVARNNPKEALLVPATNLIEVRAVLGEVCTTVVEDAAINGSLLKTQFGRPALEGIRGGLLAITLLLQYAQENLRSGLSNVTRLSRYEVSRFLLMDETTRRNLELFKTIRGNSRKGSLLDILDQASTPMGGRKLREWLGNPLLEVEAIKIRQDAVEALAKAPETRKALQEALALVADMERLSGRIAQGTAHPRTLASLKESLIQLPLVAGALKNHPALARLLPEDLAQEVAMDIGNWLVEDPPISPLEGGLVPEGADAALDRLKNLANDGKGAIARMEAELKEETGINSLKIKHVTNMGYVIDITRANLDRVPKSWLRKQTISTGERYYTLELKEYEEQVTGASEKAIQLEYRLFCALRERVAETVPRLCALARGVAEIDALCAFAEAAVRNRYVRPVFAERNEVDIRGGRHPVVEALNREERFVPNDIRLEAAAPMMILTGPNMAGKSTLMRQVALLVVMAQAGAFVPAQAARIGICDRIFVRVGASDDLSRGQSTFMVEMSETAFILGNATENSLVLLDEIGRGTSTYDGLSIAWAVAEDLHDRVKCRVIFATHYHELSALRESCARIRNMHVSVSEQGDKIVFLRRLKEGPASSSYGIQCAQLAGLPLRVVKRARSVLQTLEARRPRPEPTQLSLFGGGPEPEPQAIEEPPAPLEDPIRSFLGELDPDSLSPRDAMAALYKLKGMLDVQ